MARWPETQNLGVLGDKRRTELRLGARDIDCNSTPPLASPL